MQHTHNGESYIKFRDPSGTLGGTLVSDVLALHENITPGAVVVLEKVTVLRTPPPHSIHHLCIVPENVVRVIPRQRSGHSAGGLPLFDPSSILLSSGGGSGHDEREKIAEEKGARAGQQQEPPVQALNPSSRPEQPQRQQQQPSQLEIRNDSSVAQQAPPPPPPPQQQPSSYVQPQVDTADDLLDGLDDEFGF